MRFLMVLLFAIVAGCADDDFGRDLGTQDLSGAADGGSQDLATGD